MAASKNVVFVSHYARSVAATTIHLLGASQKWKDAPNGADLHYKNVYSMRLPNHPQFELWLLSILSHCLQMKKLLEIRKFVFQSVLLRTEEVSRIPNVIYLVLYIGPVKDCNIT